MNPVSVDIKDILVAAAIGVFASANDWGIFISQEPPGGDGDGPDRSITLYDTGGEPEDSLTGDRVDDFTFQVRTRSEVGGYESAYAKMEDIIGELNQKRNHIAGSVRYAIINREGVTEFLFRDSQNRAVFICNFAGLRTFIT